MLSRVSFSVPFEAITGAVASSSALDRVGFFSRSHNILVDCFFTKQ